METLKSLGKKLWTIVTLVTSNPILKRKELKIGIAIVVVVFVWKYYNCHVNYCWNTFDRKVVQEFCSVPSVSDESQYRDWLSQAGNGLSLDSIFNRTNLCSNYIDLFAKQVFFHPQDANRKLSYNYSDSMPKLAFSILVHDHVGIFETLLHLLYRPQHSICVYVGRNTNPEVRRAVASIVKCFQSQFKTDSVFLAQSTQNVFWGHMSVLDADLTCIEHLLTSSQPWEYYINLAGTELPLISVDEMGARLKDSGLNYSLSSSQPHLPHYKYQHFLKEENIIQTLLRGKYYQILSRSTCLKDPPPFNIKVVKSSKNVILSRHLADQFINNPMAKAFRAWLKTANIPDELFYASMVNALEKLTFKGTGFESVFEYTRNIKYGNYPKGFCPRISLWQPGYPCAGENIRSICHLTIADLPTLVDVNSYTDRTKSQEGKIQNCFFANKFNLEIDPLAVLCQARRLAIKN